MSLLDLSLVPQVVMHAASDEPVARRLQISGHTLFTNELEMLRGLLEQGCGWGFCRPIFTQRSGKTGCPPKWAAG